MTDSGNESRPLTGRTAIVTGSGRNIGRAIALAFARAGADVVINGRRDLEALERVAQEIEAHGIQALCVQADVSDPDQVQSMVNAALEHFGRVDIAVSNVGLRPRQAFLDISVEDWRRVLETNLSSAFYLARAVLPSMKENRWGRIIHVSGRDGFFTMSNRAHNVTCKAGLHSMAKAIAIEFGEYGITANTVAPGKMDTEREEKNYRDTWNRGPKASSRCRYGVLGYLTMWHKPVCISAAAALTRPASCSILTGESLCFRFVRSTFLPNRLNDKQETK